MKKLSFALILALFAVLAQSCQKDSMEEADPFAGREAPALPAAESFVMPFSGFDEEKAAPKSLRNWGHAVVNVVVWNTVITTYMAIPTLSFYAAFGQEPEYQGQGVWLWAYEFPDEDGRTYRAQLYGELLVNDEVKWDMYIEQADGFGRVHWYTGITANDDSYAHWTLNYLPENPTPFLQIDFQRDNGAGVESIRYTNIIPGDPGNGGYIEYREGPGANEEFDRAYDIFRADAGNLTEINWDSVNKDGRVRDPEKYEDTDWHCWGEDLRDRVCQA